MGQVSGSLCSAAPMALSLGALSLPASLEMGSRLRAIGGSSTSMEEVATTAVRMIREESLTNSNEPASALVRCFVTVRRRQLHGRLAELVRSRTEPNPDDQFLTLLATDGVEPDWCDRHRSRRHQIIPAGTTLGAMMFPMVTGMFRQFGDPLPVQPAQSEATVDPAERAFGVFHVENPLESPLIADHDFIARYGVASVVGVGGRLPTGEVFALLIFSREHIDQARAAYLQPWGLSITLALIPVYERVFADEVASGPSRVGEDDLRRFELATMRTLLDLQTALVSEDSRRLTASAGNEANTDPTA